MVVAVSLAASPALAGVVTRSGGRPVRGLDISAFSTTARSTGGTGPPRHPVRRDQGHGRHLLHQPVLSGGCPGGVARGIGRARVRVRQPDRAGGAATASFAVRAARYRRGQGTLPLVVDLENDPYSLSDCYWLGRARMVAWIAGFARRARALTGKWPIIYTTDAWWQECTGSTGRFSGPALAGRLRRRSPGRSLPVESVGVLAVQRERLPARDRPDRPGLVPAGRRALLAPPRVRAQAPP